MPSRPGFPHHGRRRFPRRIALLVLLVVPLFFGAREVGDEFAAIARGLNLLSTIAHEIVGNYAEPVNSANLMKAAISGMTSSLDPYSGYVDEQDKADVDMLTTGTYGGVGITVTNRGGRYLVATLAGEDVKAATGLRIGDEILRIDSTDVQGNSSLDLKRLLRGAPGSIVRILARRPGIDSTMLLPIVRRDVLVRGLSIVQTIDDGILYLKLERFPRSAGGDIAAAVRSFLASNPHPNGIVLDLRDNPGGLLDAAVEVSEVFVPAGNRIVSTRGRRSLALYTREYSSDAEPVTATLPLAILVNRNSASASEIVAGAIQDLDRGVIIGERTFGKGLVQTVLPLGNNASLKLTTSKYYTPSGRCIQKMDYGSRGRDGVIMPDPLDSARDFHSLVRGRVLHGSGGIEPDIAVPRDSSSALEILRQSGALLTFAATHIHRNRLTAVPQIDDDMKAELHAHVDTMTALVKPESEVRYRALLQQLEADGYSKKMLQRAHALGVGLREGRPDQVDARWEDVRAELQAEFASQLGGTLLRFQHAWKRDDALRRAITVLRNPAQYELVMSTGH
ncbi:MAG: S41 family peptidase [Ignavibacteria bacterium]|nr:S41 family peptidase [Ignavibacteria bacterium]